MGGYRGHRSGSFASHWNKQVSYFSFRVSKKSWTRKLKNLWTAVLVQTNDPIGLLSWEHLPYAQNSVLREFDIINPGLTPSPPPPPPAAEGKFWPWCADEVESITTLWPSPVGSCIAPVSLLTVNLFLLPFPWPNSDLSIRLTVLKWSVTNQFAHYIVKSSMCKLEGKNSTDGLIISTQTGRIDRFIYKNTISLELNSVKISVLVYTLFFYGFTGKSPLFCRDNCKNPFDSTSILQWLWKKVEWWRTAW